MADFIFNVALGRVSEFAQRVDSGDPAGARFVVLLLASTGLEAEADLKDSDTFADVVDGTTNEATNTNYAKKILAAADVGPFAPDDTGDKYDIDIPDQTWAGVAADGTGNIGALVIGYTSSGASPTDAQITPISHHTFSVVPDGSDITAQIATGGFYSAAQG